MVFLLVNDDLFTKYWSSDCMCVSEFHLYDLFFLFIIKTRRFHIVRSQISEVHK